MINEYRLMARCDSVVILTFLNLKMVYVSIFTSLLLSFHF